MNEVDIGPLRALRFRVYVPLRSALSDDPLDHQRPPTFRTPRPQKRPFVLHVGRVMKSISHLCASTSGRRLMTLVSTFPKLPDSSLILR